MGILADSAAEEAARTSSSSPVRRMSDVLPPNEFEFQVVEEFAESKKGAGCLRGDWKHEKSVSSAYWDSRGRGIVSTSYDDSLRCRRVSSPSLNAVLMVGIDFAQYGILGLRGLEGTSH